MDDSHKLADDIGRILGADRVRAPLEDEMRGARMVVEPRSTEEIAELVRKCEADSIALAPAGASRTLSQIRSTPVGLAVSLAQMARVLDYQPDDMTVIVEPGITVAELNRHLAPRGQRLPLDPWHPEVTTIGAAIGAAHAGPSRLAEGNVRDLLIGVRYAGHGGRIVHGGGRVVKNVAGYDLMKVMTGSFGTLGIVVEACFKVRPLPENYALALKPFAAASDAFASAAALHNELSMLHLEVLSYDAAAHFGHPDDFLVMAGFAGNQSELTYQRDRIARMLGADTQFLDGGAADETYRRLRDFAYPENTIAARISVAARELPGCARVTPAEFIAHPGSGTAELWMEHAGETDAQAIARWRQVARAGGGHLRVLFAPDTIRPKLQMFDQPSPGAFKLMRRMKAAFDPAGIFNPGCFVGGL